MRGFTLLEILIVLAIFSALIAGGLPITTNMYREFLFSSERDRLIATIRKARNQAFTNLHAAPHGLYIASSSMTIFEGASYATREESLDNQISRSPAITIVGPTEMVFQPLSGRTSAATLVFTHGEKVASISLNTEGALFW